MKYCIMLSFLVAPFSLAVAQSNHLDTLQLNLKKADNDKANYWAYLNLAYYYEELNIDSSIFYGDKALLIAKKNKQEYAEAVALNNKAYQFLAVGNYNESLKYLQQAYHLVETPDNKKSEWGFEERLVTLSTNHHMFGLLMNATGNRVQQIFHYKEAIRIAENADAPFRIHMAYSNLASTFSDLGMQDSALIFAKKADAIKLSSEFNKWSVWNLYQLGKIYLRKGEKEKGKNYYYQAINACQKYENQSCLNFIYKELTDLYLSEGKKDSSLYYALRTLQNIDAIGNGADVSNNIGIAYENLYLSYKLNSEFDSAFKYQGLALLAKDSLYKSRIKSLSDFQNLTFSDQLRLQNVEQEKVLYQNKIRTYALLAGLSVFLIVALILYRNNHQKRKANNILENTLTNLKTTQSQLIQSEKMASLGELTAGIAHEIQNPLNFVNNFSEVNTELIEELKSEKLKVKNERDEQLENELLNDIAENEKKINHHGKRADAIVKGMLQHSQASSGQKEPTDINKLADEYLSLSYHGLRAKDNSFNATLKTDFDESIRKINIIPQDIGRVLLNLFSNAFYAVAPPPPPAGGGISDPAMNKNPTVWVSTKKEGNKVLISVRDNGNGIPKKVIDKIFQPFFTTKPTGQGTGLGLSLAYDIVKAHGGEIKVNTIENDQTEFIITLPIA